MGELPHQWLEIRCKCACAAWIERWIKFTDGIVREITARAPKHEAGFFDDAGEL